MIRSTHPYIMDDNIKKLSTSGGGRWYFFLKLFN